MSIRTLMGALAGVLAIGLLLWLGIYAYDNIVVSSGIPISERRDQPAVLTAFLVAKPNFVVDGSNLDKVEIWAVPASANEEVSEEDYLLIGDATLQAGVDSATQIWILPIPPEPIASTEIFAKGFDGKGDFVGQMSLPYLGATQILATIWSDPAPVVTSSVPSAQRHFSFTLKTGEKYAAGNLTVRLAEIKSDSRCPQVAVCIWAGEVSARVQLAVGGRAETVIMHSMSAPSFFDGYQIGITDVDPPRLEGTPPSKDEYKITFSVERM